MTKEKKKKKKKLKKKISYKILHVPDGFFSFLPVFFIFVIIL